MDKKTARLRRAVKARAKMKEINAVRLSIYRTPRHIYAQLIGANGKVLTVASTLDHEVKKELGEASGVAAAKIVGKFIAQRGQAIKIKKVAFDRSGFRYHGRILALAESARENGLEF
jgi:large subunit ribosomal protein L18